MRVIWIAHVKNIGFSADLIETEESQGVPCVGDFVELHEDFQLISVMRRTLIVGKYWEVRLEVPSSEIALLLYKALNSPEEYAKEVNA